MNLIRMMKSLKKEQNGTAMIEFAIVMPILLMLALTGYQAADKILLEIKLEQVAYSVADVLSQNQSITNAQVNDVFGIAQQLAEPFPFGSTGVVHVTSAYREVGDANARVIWQRDGGGSGVYVSKIGAAGSQAVLPNGLTLNEKDNVIISEVYYQYTPLITFGVFQPKVLYKAAVFKPRLGNLTTAPT